MRLTTEIMRFVDETLRLESRAPTVQEIAARIGWSRYRLTRYFSKIRGIPVSKFVRERQIALARRLLRQTDWQVKEVARRCGFATSSSFSTTFKVAVGSSPRHYRAQRGLRKH